MSEEEMIKEAYILMVKNNPDEAIKNLIRLDKELAVKNNKISKAIEYMKNIQWFYLKNNEGLQLYATTDNFYNDLSYILRGEDNGR